MNRYIPVFLFGLLALPITAVWGAQNKPSLFDRPRASTGPLFHDPVVAKAKDFQIKQSQVEQMYLSFKGHRAAMGQHIPDEARARIEADIIEKLIATQLFLRRATTQDKAQAKEIADSFLAEQKKQVMSEDSFRRQLLAVGMSTQEFNTQIHEQAIVKAVIDREIKTKVKVTDAEVKQFYNDNPKLFEEPELARASHILIPTRDTITGKPLTPEAKLQKRKLAEQVLARARSGEDFAKLVREFSVDNATKDRGGEYTFARAKDSPGRAMAPEFEAAAFSMKPNQISDLVETGYGYHIIKLLEKIPRRKIDFKDVEGRIRESLLREGVEKALPDYIAKLKKEAGVEILAQNRAR